MTQVHPTFNLANVSTPNLGISLVRLSHGLEVGLTWGKPRLAAVFNELGTDLGFHNRTDMQNTIKECEYCR